MEPNAEYQRILESYMHTLHNLQSEQEAAITRLKNMLEGAFQEETDTEDVLLIERELDIIRGRIPTPKGYRIDKRRIRKLQSARNRLQKGI